MLLAHSQALALWQQIGHRRGQTTTLLAMAAIHEDNGDRDGTLDSLNRATVLWDELGATVKPRILASALKRFGGKLELLHDGGRLSGSGSQWRR